MCHGDGSPVDTFRSHVSTSLFICLPLLLLPAGQKCFITVGNLFRGILFTCWIQLLLYSSNLSKIGVILKSLQFVLLFRNLSQVYPAVLLLYFIPAAVILLASLALTVQVSLPHNNTGTASVLCSFILVYKTIYKTISKHKS